MTKSKLLKFLKQVTDEYEQERRERVPIKT